MVIIVKSLMLLSLIRNSQEQVFLSRRKVGLRSSIIFSLSLPCSFLKLPLCLLFSNYPPLHLFFLSFFFLIFIFYILLLFVMYLFQIFFSMSMKFDSFLLITGIPLPELAFVDSLLGIHPLIVFYLSSS